MELVLIRHGEAEERLPDTFDAARALTEKGRRRLRSGMKQLPLVLDKSKDIRIWSSPHLRASQSARIIAELLRTGPVEYKDFLGTGDSEAFTMALSEIPKSACLIVVGHEPFLGEWGLHLAGIHLPFRKGTAAAFALDRTRPLHGTLRWLLDLKTLERMGRRNKEV